MTAAVLRLTPGAPAPETPVITLPGINTVRAAQLRRLGILTVRDLLLHLPRRYEDTRDVRPLAELHPGSDAQTVRARVRRISQRRSHRRHISLVEAVLEDDGAIAHAIWFNQPFLMGKLHEGDELLLSGKVDWSRGGLTLRNPQFEPVVAGQRHVGRLAPVYPETQGLSSRWLRDHILRVLPAADLLEEALPEEVRVDEDLPPLGLAVRLVHAPDDPEAAAEGRQRIAFDELFLLQLAARRARRRRMEEAGVVVPYDVEVARAFASSLPFRLTDAQRVAAHEILTDMAAPGPMNRLLQGDVGSGKTAVAAMAAMMAHAAGLQTLVMAPTEILARQHHAVLDRLLAPHGVAVRLLLGATGARVRREVLAGLASGQDTVAVGTHALIEDDVRPAALGLVVVDEQHRFGVAQRQRLRRKAVDIPNFLSMTATPIPRSLALTLYGDLDVSALRDMPPGRIPVNTLLVDPERRFEAYEFVRRQVQEGRQAFVICPLVEESDKLGVRSATAEWQRLSTEVFPDLRVELLHGRMPSRDKEARMARFAAGEADLLVATTVVEVGVDVANATVMMVEDAERFGLAQLHQLRGRVGRGEHAAHCLLLEGAAADDAGRERLRAVAGTTSGFALAELDLRLRGPGDVVGLRQHGLPEMRAGDLLDLVLMERAAAAAERWLDEDPTLTAHPPLAEAMNGYRAVFDLD